MLTDRKEDKIKVAQVSKAGTATKAFINAMRLFCCLFILLNAKGDAEFALKQWEGSALRYRWIWD
jgi:hypothetical protein